MNFVNVILSSDNNYAQCLGVVLCSIFKNKSKDYLINVYVIDGGISIDNKNKLNEIEKKYLFTIKYLYLDVKKYKNLFISGHITQACYYRILIPELVDKEIEKIIYLDCDLIVLGNLIDLFNIDINNYFVGAVEEKLFDIKEALGMDENTPYFNSGVMLINLKEWRKNNISEKTLDFIRRSPEKIKLYDQDALNFILANKCLILNKKYNQIILGLKKTNIPDNTFIIHYTGTYKPWHFVYNGSYKKLYKKYLKLTPWNNYRYSDLNLNNILKKILFNILSVKNIYKVVKLKKTIGLSFNKKVNKKTI